MVDPLVRVLVACEFSGVVRDAFKARGHYALSVDFLPTEQPGLHLRCDVRKLLRVKWDLMLAFPPCQFLARSGLHWNSRIAGRAEKTEQALDFVLELMNAPIERICVENPQGAIGTRIKKPTQVIQPYQFGHRESKATCLWLKNLPPLRQTHLVTLGYGECWDNTRPDGQHKRPGVKTRAHDASRTYAGVARAMAEQWG
jgi:hypothetical protein